jgi:hypothetical protein
MLDLQHQYNNGTTIPHMREDSTYWGPPSCEELLYSCCIGVVQESNPVIKMAFFFSLFFLGKVVSFLIANDNLIFLPRIVTQIIIDNVMKYNKY